MIRRVVMHPCDARRAQRVAARLGAVVTLSENWAADAIGLEGAVLTSDVAVARELLPGWRIVLLDEPGDRVLGPGT